MGNAVREVVIEGVRFFLPPSEAFDVLSTKDENHDGVLSTDDGLDDPTLAQELAKAYQEFGRRVNTPGHPDAAARYQRFSGTGRGSIFTQGDFSAITPEFMLEMARVIKMGDALLADFEKLAEGAEISPNITMTMEYEYSDSTTLADKVRFFDKNNIAGRLQQYFDRLRALSEKHFNVQSVCTGGYDYNAVDVSHLPAEMRPFIQRIIDVSRALATQYIGPREIDLECDAPFFGDCSWSDILSTGHGVFDANAEGSHYYLIGEGRSSRGSNACVWDYELASVETGTPYPGLDGRRAPATKTSPR